MHKILKELLANMGGGGGGDALTLEGGKGVCRPQDPHFQTTFLLRTPLFQALIQLQRSHFYFWKKKILHFQDLFLPILAEFYLLRHKFLAKICSGDPVFSQKSVPETLLGSNIPTQKFCRPPPPPTTSYLIHLFPKNFICAIFVCAIFNCKNCKTVVVCFSIS